MIGDFLGAVIGNVADDHAVPGRGIDVDVVISDTGADHAAAARRTREAGFAQDREVVEKHDRIGLRKIPGQLGLIAGSRHDEVGNVVQNGGLDRGLVQEIGDQHRESIRH